jgi:hypothetical protein
MSSFLDIALPLAERGFQVFPLIPGKKRPISSPGEYDHFDTATTDPAQIEAWDKQQPDCNVGMIPDEHFCYVETDDEAALKEACKDLPPDVWNTTRVSARENRCYYIFKHTSRSRKSAIKDKSCKREGQENLFEFKAFRTYVTGPGSTHPVTGQPYSVEWKRIPVIPDALLNRLCEQLGEAKATDTAVMGEETKRQTELLDKFLETFEVAVTGDWFNKGKQWFRPVECPWNDQHENDSGPSSTCVVYIEGGGYGFDCKHRCAGKGWQEFKAELQSRFPDRKFRFTEPTAEVTIGSSLIEPSKAVTDWRARYHSFDEMSNAPEPTFIIEGFLQKDVISAIAAPVGQRKTIIAANAVHASITGEPLFDYFKVTERPTRTLYLCPEMGLFAFAKRIRNLGLMPYVGKTLFCRTMNSEGKLLLSDLATEELAGALVVIDTAVRFVEGDENSSEDMKVFADDCFRLMRAGAASVLVLFHSPKGTKEASELTLENAMRGSGDLGAFVSSCWATRLQNPDAGWEESISYLKNVKQRDFESNPFTVKSDKLGRLHIVDEPDANVKLSSKQVGPPGDKDGRQAEALQIIRDNAGLSNVKLSRKLKENGIDRSPTWVGNKRSEATGTGVVTGSV